MDLGNLPPELWVENVQEKKNHRMYKDSPKAAIANTFLASTYFYISHQNPTWYNITIAILFLGFAIVWFLIFVKLRRTRNL